jgi:hypothetical protein
METWALFFPRVGIRVRRDIRFEANISKYEAIIYSIETNKTSFIRLFRIKFNRWILHAKRIKEANIPFLSKYFKKEPNIN